MPRLGYLSLNFLAIHPARYSRPSFSAHSRTFPVDEPDEENIGISGHSRSLDDTLIESVESISSHGWGWEQTDIV